ncbi:MAG: hypothetical protein A2X86_20915 [Bdellovibrionales bacterium GWA2_49_15]|nr:MAG: hypothetical protein A2X86_20915 [Bdellovibrionales bacterium GWA2_49_15]HAZ14840.1 hypothetical protein [Bdellovibrionales bacterium]
MDLELKQQQFNLAMERYERNRFYKIFGKCIAFSNVTLQIFLLLALLPFSIGWPRQIIALLLAFLVTDFINGLVHLYMDHNDSYETWAGPLIANFHLHHRTPKYQDHNLLAVYFVETGSKIWLVFYLGLVACLSPLFPPNSVLLFTLVYIGVLSSVAEVSHYLCHNSRSPVVDFLARLRILLSKKQHSLHHREDNISYTFLNGLTDPLVNIIARKYFTGYKNGTDLHFAKYRGGQARE